MKRHSKDKNALEPPALDHAFSCKALPLSLQFRQEQQQQQECSAKTSSLGLKPPGSNSLWQRVNALLNEDTREAEQELTDLMKSTAKQTSCRALSAKMKANAPEKQRHRHLKTSSCPSNSKLRLNEMYARGARLSTTSQEDMMSTADSLGGDSLIMRTELSVAKQKAVTAPKPLHQSPQPCLS